MSSVDEQRAALQGVLDQAQAWFHEVESQRPPVGDLPGLENDVAAIRQLRVRVGSALINVAMFGGSSSGKSFLASGLQGGLEYLRAPSVQGVMSDKYIGLLPFSPTPTSCCPARIVPVSGIDASGPGLMRVRFIGSADQDWTDIGKPANPAMVAAYAMYKADVADRLREHMSMQVAEVEISYSDFAIAASIYDLPGYGSVNPNHEKIARQATWDADCFIYVANAARSLETNQKDLELINFLYEQHKPGRKRVIWVLTAIDKAMDLTRDNEPEWKLTLAENNEYLKRTFTDDDGRPDIAFIGQGFISVSPALEAQARYYRAEHDIARSQTLLAESRMDELRQVLRSLIAAGTGQRHLSQIAADAHAIVTPRQRALSGVLSAERLPYSELTGERDAVEGQLRKVDTVSAKTRIFLDDLLARAVRSAERPFPVFPGHLHEQLDSAIKAANLRDDKERNALTVRKTRVTSEWLTAPTGPATLWEAEFPPFEEAAVSYVRSELGTAGAESAIGKPPPLGIRQLTKMSPVRRRNSTGSGLEKTALFVTAATPVSAGIGWALGAALSAVVWPAAAVTAAAVVTFATLNSVRNRGSAMDAARQELINDIDNEAANIQHRFITAVKAQGQFVIDSTLNYLTDYRGELEQLLATIERRIAEPETAERVELIRQLEPLEETAIQIVASLDQLTIK